jgi:hypothetical protein
LAAPVEEALQAAAAAAGRRAPDRRPWREGSSSGNLLPAHLTLFHRLSSAQTARLSDLVVPVQAGPILCDGLFLLGSGVAVRIRSKELEQVHGAACDAMGGR